MKPSVAWLFKMINSRCRHWCNDGYPRWWACYFNYKSSGLRGSIWEGFGNNGGFCKSVFLYSKGSHAHSKQGSSPPSHTFIPKLSLPTSRKSQKRRHLIFIIWKIGPTSSSFTKPEWGPCVFLLFNVYWSIKLILLDWMKDFPNHRIFYPSEYCLHLFNI